MVNRGKVMLAVLLFVAVATVATANTAVGAPRVEQTTDREQSRQVVEGTRWWPYGLGWGWGWGIAVFVLAIVKGSILLGLFIIWAFFKGFGKKSGGCAPIIIRESAPPISFEHHHPWDRSAVEYGRSKRSPDYLDSELYWTDLVTDIGFSFLGVHSNDCRKRFVCEVDVRERRDPMLKFATSVFGIDIFRRYRSAEDKNATSFQECAKLYEQCKLEGPSISFNVFAKPIDLLQDLNGNTQDQAVDEVSNDEETTENSETQDESTEGATTTTEEIPKKKSYNKRKRYFKTV